MTYLQQALAKQRAARLSEEDFSTCEDGPAATLTVQASPTEVWVFPWAAFAGAWFDQATRNEEFVLTFSRNAILIRGRNLDRLVAATGAMRLESVRVRLDGAQAQRGAVDKTVIVGIKVSESEPMLAAESVA